jgi:ATP-binding cassette subfamily B protein
LDEPTHSVDPVSASLTNEAVARVPANKTTLVIAHHFVAMQKLDQIVVLKDGKIVEHGPHSYLFYRKVSWYEPCRRQVA